MTRREVRSKTLSVPSGMSGVLPRATTWCPSELARRPVSACAHFVEHRVDSALRHYEAAADLLRREPATLRVDALTGVAACLRRRGDLQHAIFVLENLKETLDREGYCDPAALFKVYASLVAPYFEAGAHERASESAARALELAPHCGDDERLGRMYMSAGRTHLERGHFDEAREAFSIAGTLFHRADLLVEIGQSHLALGFGYVREGDGPRARRELAAALEIFRSTGSILDEARTLNEYAYLERIEGHDEAARQAATRSIELLDTGIDVKALANAHRELGMALAESDLEEAQKHLRMAVELYERVGSTIDVARTYRSLGDVFYRRGDVAAACEEYRAGMEFLDYGR